MTDLPILFQRLRQEYPEVVAAYDTLGSAIHQKGFLNRA